LSPSWPGLGEERTGLTDDEPEPLGFVTEFGVTAGSSADSGQRKMFDVNVLRLTGLGIPGGQRP
jgi:hypothetical protein